MLQAAVNATEAEAFVPFGDCYCNVIGIERNYDAALDCYKRAEDQHVVLTRL